MTTPSPEIRKQLETVTLAASQLMNRAGALWTEAADQSDTAKGLGIDDRINLMHNLVDVWVKGYASMVQAVLASQQKATTNLMTKRLTQKVTVDKEAYDRTLSAEGPFVRVGIDSRVIPESGIAFDPPILPAEQTTFTIAVADLNFVGANYRGHVRLTPVNVPAGAKGDPPVPQTAAITVGL